MKKPSLWLVIVKVFNRSIEHREKKVIFGDSCKFSEEKKEY